MIKKTTRMNGWEEEWCFDSIEDYVDWVEYNLYLANRDKETQEDEEQEKTTVH